MLQAPTGEQPAIARDRPKTPVLKHAQLKSRPSSRPPSARPPSRLGASPLQSTEVDSDDGFEETKIQFNDEDIDADDLEAQSPRWQTLTVGPSKGAEYDIDTRTKLLCLAGWFSLNLCLTIYNKAILGGFDFPWLLTAIHTGFAWAGTHILVTRARIKTTTLSTNENLILLAFSILFTSNIAISNVSLAAVSVPFHQIMRSTTPAATVLIYRFYYSRSYQTQTYLSIIPIILGVGLATYGDYHTTIAGFILTALGVLLASVKTIVSNRLMTGNLALPPLELLLRMSPLAALQSISVAWVTGESSRFVELVKSEGIPTSTILALVGNGTIAFLLNVSSFQTNKLAGALTLTVAGNMKQILTILLGIVLFDVKVGMMNGIGMLITVMGAAWYSKAELDSKGKR